MEVLRLESDDFLDGGPPLSERFQALLGRLEEIWGVEFRLDTRLDVPVSNSRERELLRIVQEAVVNASRHGKASLVRVSVSADEEGVSVGVSDNGSGFPFFGRFDHAQLSERQVGLVSLMGRVAAIGGCLSIDWSSGGAEVSVALPREGGA